jgi:hypothetical protein
MNTLPVVDLNYDDHDFTDLKKFYCVEDNDPVMVSGVGTYEDLCREIHEFISADCHAVTVKIEGHPEEILYQKKTIRDKILDDVVREKLYTRIHASVLCDLHRKGLPALIRIYMFGEWPWTVNILYGKINGYHRYFVQLFQSEAYLKQSVIWKKNREEEEKKEVEEKKELEKKELDKKELKKEEPMENELKNEEPMGKAKTPEKKKRPLTGFAMFYKIKTKEILVNYRQENNMSENEKINPIDAMVIVAKAWSEYKKDETKKAEMDRIAAEYNEEHGRKAAPKQKDNASDKNELKKEEPKEKELKKEEPKEKELKKEEPSAGNITDQNFLEAGHSHGINTVGQSLKKEEPEEKFRWDKNE